MKRSSIGPLPERSLALLKGLGLASQREKIPRLRELSLLDPGSSNSVSSDSVPLDLYSSRTSRFDADSSNSVSSDLGSSGLSLLSLNLFAEARSRAPCDRLQSTDRIASADAPTKTPAGYHQLC